MDDEESSEGERLAMFQRQAKRRYLNKHKVQQESVATLPGYTSQAEPPDYPQLTAEEADEERDEVGDVVRRVRLRRKRSGSDSYLDSLLARSVHALELSNALLQSSMTTQSSLSALLAREDQLDSHAQFLANQIHASDSRRVWVDDLTRQLDPGLSQSLPDSSDSGLRRGDRPRSPPPRCMTVYADHAQDPGSILIPSTNGLRSAARTHDLVPRSRNHSRQSSVSEDGIAPVSALYALSAASSPQLSTPAPRRVSGRRTVSSVHLPPEPSSTAHGQTTYSPSAPSPYLSSPVRPILSSVPAEPSTPAYNLLSAIVTRTPGTDSESEGRRPAASDSRTRLAPPTDSRLSVDPRVPRIESQISPGLDKRPRHLSENDMGTARGQGWVAPMVLAGQKRGDGRDKGLDEGGQGRLGRSQSGRAMPQSGTSSRSGSKPPTPNRTNSQVTSPHRSGSTASSNPGASGIPSPNRPVRHPFLAAPAGARRRSISTEDDRTLQRYKSADALRRILDDAAAKRRQEQEEEEERAREREQEQEQERGRKPPARPNWSVIPRRGTTVAVETVATVGQVSIDGITGTGGGTGKKREGTGRQVDPLVLPGEFGAGPVTAEPKSGLTVTRQNTVTRDTLTFERHDTLTPDRHDTLTPGRHDTLTPGRRDTLTPDSPTRQRSQSMGPVTRFGSLLPKISVFGKTGVGDGPVDKGKGKAVDEGATRARDIPRAAAEERSKRAEDLSKTPVPGPSFAAELSVQLNGADMDPEETTSESESESQPSLASLPLPPRLFIDSTESITGRPSSLRLSGSPRPSSFRQPNSGASTPRSVTFSPLPPKHVPFGGRPLSEAKTRRTQQKEKNKEKEKPGWFASWFGPLPSSGSGSGSASGKYGSSRRGWDSPRSMDDWQM